MPVPKKFVMDNLNTAFFEHYVKRPLQRAIVNHLIKYPEPTRENVTKRNALVWLGIRDKYLEYETSATIQQMAKVFFDLIICEYQHDSPYEERIDYVVTQLVLAYLSGKFKLRGRPPAILWDKPETADILARERQLVEELDKALRNMDWIRRTILEKELLELIDKRDA